jgi:hypothetical protein
MTVVTTRDRAVSAIVLCLVLAAASKASAQVPYEGCTTRQGRPIVGIVSDSLPYAGWATIRSDGTPVIYWNPKRQYSPQGVTQVYLYLHECAHHALGHVYRPLSTMDEKQAAERQADCWAYELLVDGGMVTGSRLEVLERDIRNTIGDAVHLNGEGELNNVHACLDARTDARQWRAMLTEVASAALDSFRVIRGAPLREDTSVSEVTRNAPGTFDCEIRASGSYVCVVFAARDDGRVDRRFRKLRDIVTEWLPGTWTSTTLATPPAGQRQVFVAEDASTGVRITLSATVDRKIFFIMRPRST